jgi:hypothetical protein
MEIKTFSGFPEKAPEGVPKMTPPGLGMFWFGF